MLMYKNEGAHSGAAESHSIFSCFIPDEEKRPTAQQLLESTFIEKHRYGVFSFSSN